MAMSAYLARLKALTAKNGETPLPNKPSKPSKAAFEPFEGDQDRCVCRKGGPPVPTEAAQSVDVDSVPEPYRDALTRLRCQRPPNVSDDEWRQAVNDAGQLFDTFTVPLFAQFDWMPGDLFDVPHDGAAGGLVWFLNGEVVRSPGA